MFRSLPLISHAYTDLLPGLAADPAAPKVVPPAQGT